jgi:nucleotide-binding universal stress UspA family protein
MSIKHMLVAMDFEPASEAALAYARRLAAALEAKLSAVHVLHLPEVQNLAAVPPAIRREAELSAERKLSRETADIARRGELRVRSGEPGQTIVASARELGADLIVMGSHNRRGIAHALLGSTAESVARNAACSVLVVRQASDRNRD